MPKITSAHKPAANGAPALAHAPLLSNGSAAMMGPESVERRSEPRYPTYEPAELELLSTPGESVYGTVLDISRSGLRLALPRRINRGEQVKVKLNQNVIFGEIRYCRAVYGGFHAGLKIQDLVRPSEHVGDHIADDPLSLYAAGKGLSVTEVIGVREHLIRCGACRARLAEKEALLNPRRRSKSEAN